ncbi:hypothetical protein FGD67_06015 [Colwellia sp. M166]|uniref:hypothetical protein n=1 Tax=Colwellia sp. M166 TaxID=2583805 RepID=UPI00211DFC0F|nr:hypothetical protein [Colwellia sp. M166]UUO22788.1 hypothetical protein FGD67_06015 [Colwellia sp. M166]|tara:strand:+ start:8232 stop:8414 length:183 start_codon:yes stop_codon:yes gene_type:complete
MNKILLAVLCCFCVFFAPLTFAGGGGGGGGTTGGSSVPSLHILVQLFFVLLIALWYRKPK